MFAMSAGFRKFIGLRPEDTPPPTDSGTPSMTNSGSLLAFTEVPPRMRIEMPPPGSLLSITCTPGTLAWISCSGLTTRPTLKSFSFTVSATPVRSRTSRTPPYPVMTTPLIWLAVSLRVKSLTAVAPAATTTLDESGAYPMRLARTRCVPASMMMVYRPSSRVIAPNRVPITTTSAPMMGLAPSEDLTVPVIRPVCASAGSLTHRAANRAMTPVRHISAYSWK